MTYKKLAILLTMVFIAGCTQTRVESFLKASPEVINFLQQYPDAKIATSLVAQGAIVTQIGEIKKECNNFPLSSYYKSVLTEEKSGIKLTVWIDAKDYKFVCIVKESGGGKEQITITSTTTSSLPTTTFQTTSTTSQLKRQFSCDSESPEVFGTKPNPTRIRIASKSPTALTEDFTLKYSNWNIAPTIENLKTLEDAAKQRKKNFIQTMRENPDAVLDSVLQSDIRGKLSLVGANCVETLTDVEGFLEVWHADFFQDNTSVTRYYLITEDKTRLAIYPAGELKDFLESRTKVKIRGYRIDSELVFDGSKPLQPENILQTGIKVVQTPEPVTKQDISPAETQQTQSTSIQPTGVKVLSRPGNPPVFGNQKIAVIMVYFNNTERPSYTKEYIKNNILSPLNNYYSENSYGKISVSEDVFGWYQMPTSFTCSNQQYGQYSIPAIQVAEADIFYPNYGRILVIANYNSSECDPFYGSSSIGTVEFDTTDTASGKWSASTSEVELQKIEEILNATIRVLSHELGHAFGNDHARSLLCSRSTFESDCFKREYGDDYDVMGNGEKGLHFNAPHKEHMGWLNSSNIKTVAETGTYSIEPIESATNGLKAVKIPRSMSDYIYIEYRRPLGFDNRASVSPKEFDGAILHTGPAHNPFMLYINPLRQSALLGVGQSLIDPLSLTNITVLSATQDNLTINISYHPPLIENNPPIISKFKVSVRRERGGTLASFRVNVDDADSNYLNYTLYVDAENLTGTKFTGTISPVSFGGDICSDPWCNEYFYPPSKTYVARIVINDGKGGIVKSGDIKILSPWPSDAPSSNLVPCTDGDHDGYGKANTDLSGCGKFIPDCDDSKNYVSPGAQEECNGKDENCNGKMDDGIPDYEGNSGQCLGYNTCADAAGIKSKTNGVCQYALVSCSGGKWYWNYSAGAKNYFNADYETEEGNKNLNNCNDGNDNDCDGLGDCGNYYCAGQSWTAGSGEYSNGVCNTFCNNLAQQTCAAIGGSQGQGQGTGQGGGGYQTPSQG